MRAQFGVASQRLQSGELMDARYAMPHHRPSTAPSLQGEPHSYNENAGSTGSGRSRAQPNWQRDDRRAHLQHTADKPDRQYAQTGYDQHIEYQSDSFAPFPGEWPSMRALVATARRSPSLEELGHRLVPVV
jgi:hypothetical protein